MEKSFASLLRHSKLATFDRRLSQVYSSPKQCKQRGDWGFKRNLPTVIRTPFITIGELDTIEHQTPWESGHSQVAFIQRWKENFANVTSSSRRSTYRPPHKPQQMQHQQDNYHNLTSMSRAQFDHFIKHAITPDTARAFHQALQSHQMTRDQVYDFLQVTFRPEANTVVGPIYNNNNNNNKRPSEEVIVQGRILNTQSGGYAVGIGGVVGFLPKRYAVGIKKPGDRLVVRSFYVRHAYIDDTGKPQVTVSLHPRPSPATTPLSDMVSSPTTALPSATSSHKRNRWDALFATTPPPNDMDDFERFLWDTQQHMSTSKSPPLPSTTSSPSTDSLSDEPSELMNRIITMLKNDRPSNKN